MKDIAEQFLNIHKVNKSDYSKKYTYLIEAFNNKGIVTSAISDLGLVEKFMRYINLWIRFKSLPIDYIDLKFNTKFILRIHTR